MPVAADDVRVCPLNCCKCSHFLQYTLTLEGKKADFVPAMRSGARLQAAWRRAVVGLCRCRRLPAWRFRCWESRFPNSLNSGENSHKNAPFLCCLRGLNSLFAGAVSYQKKNRRAEFSAWRFLIRRGGRSARRRASRIWCREGRSWRRGECLCRRGGRRGPSPRCIWDASG